MRVLRLQLSIVGIVALVVGFWAQGVEAGLINRIAGLARSASASKSVPEPKTPGDPVITIPDSVITSDPGATSAAEEIPAPGASVANCCPQPCILYHHKGPKLCCGDCRPPTQTVLNVKHPCVCCAVDVPICVPACCTGEPKICYGSGFLGRDVVEYEWCCGYSVRVAFRHCGDLLVTTWGR